MKINEELLKSLEVAGCHEWVTAADWRWRHRHSYNQCVEEGIHVDICREMGWRYQKAQPEIRKKAIREFLKKNNRFPLANSKDEYEKRLHANLATYCSNDPKFEKWARKNGYGDKRNPRKWKIMIFVNENNRFPSAKSKNFSERILGGACNNYCNKLDRNYDRKFDKWARQNGYNNGAIK